MRPKQSGRVIRIPQVELTNSATVGRRWGPSFGNRIAKLLLDLQSTGAAANTLQVLYFAATCGATNLFFFGKFSGQTLERCKQPCRRSETAGRQRQVMQHRWSSDRLHQPADSQVRQRAAGGQSLLTFPG